MINLFKNKKFYLSFFILIISVVFSYILISKAIAEDVSYPITELGNCGNKEDCKVFCDNPSNMTVCVNFAEKNNLMSKDEATRAKKFQEIGTGPGGCKTKDSCEAYCNDVGKIDECLTFAKENNLMSESELKEAEQVKAALDKGAKMPGGCKNKTECDAYCQNSDNMEECVSFAEAAGFMSSSELNEAKQALVAIHKGIKPPACRGKEACDAYCSDESHFEECMAFAEAAGFMSAKDAEMARKTGGQGPGGCKGKACEKFCENPDNAETCFNFAKEHGLISDEELKQMEGGKKQMQDALNNAPVEVINCLSGILGVDTVQKIKNGTAMPSKQAGDAMGQCFQSTMGPNNQQGPQTGPEGGQVPEGFTGPGGCKSPEECQAFCQDPNNQTICENYQWNPMRGPNEQEQQQQQNMMNQPKQTGPGGCQSQEECQAYCSSHPQECGAPPSGGDMIQGPPPGEDFNGGFPQNGMPPEGFSPEQMQQMQQQQQQMQMPPQDQMPPSGMMNQMPPPGENPPSFNPPPTEPPPNQPPPTSQKPLQLLLGTLLSPFLLFFAQ